MENKLKQNILLTIKRKQINEKTRSILLKNQNKDEVLAILKDLNIPVSETNVERVSLEYNMLNILTDLLKQSNGNIETAERGIIVLDKFEKYADNKNYIVLNDKLSEESRKYSIYEQRKKIWKKQNILLLYLIGTIIPVEYEGREYKFDTSKLTFICMDNYPKLFNEECTLNDYINKGYLEELLVHLEFLPNNNEAIKRHIK